MERTKSLLNPYRVNLNDDCGEYLTVGIDTVTFKTMVRIHTSFEKYITFPGKHFGGIQTRLREKMCDDWFRDVVEECTVTIEVLGDPEIWDQAFQLKGENGEVVITSEAVYELVYDKASEIQHIIKSYLFDYHRIKPILREIQSEVCKEYSSNPFDRIFAHLKKLKQKNHREYYILSEYFRIKVTVCEKKLQVIL